MAVSNYIQEVMKAAGGRNRSTAWFRNKIKELGDPTPSQLIRDGDVGARPFDGLLNMFFYDPKMKKKLPYYDRFPLIFPFDSAPGGFMGLNLHYLPPLARAKLMDGLWPLIDDDKLSPGSKLSISYQTLKRASRLRYFKPCVKRYLNNHVKSRFVTVYPEEWNIAVFLPTERFAKASKASVYADSIGKY